MSRDHCLVLFGPAPGGFLLAVETGSGMGVAERLDGNAFPGRRLPREDTNVTNTDPDAVVQAIRVMSERDGLDEKAAREDLARVAHDVGVQVEDVAASVVLSDE